MKIFELFLDRFRLKFSDIEKEVKIRSNKLSYHIDSLKKSGLIEKSGEYYILTSKAEGYLPIISGKSKDASSIGPIPIILCAITSKDRVLLIKRTARPYKNYWSLIGGKILLHEDIKSAALRKAKEETGIDCEFKSLNAILHEHVETNGKIKHSFILFFVKLHPKKVKSAEGKWFDINKIKNEEIIPTDYYLIKNMLNSKIKMHGAQMIDAENILSLKKIKTL
ncbi:MAG: NUDIX domain-containing protein [Candidatus Woesearchaeota archaeon]